MNKFKSRKIKGLILYKSEYGATAEISASIKQGIENAKGKKLIYAESRGLNGGLPSFKEYDFFVFGSGIYRGHIDSLLSGILADNYQTIRSKPHLAFIVCGTAKNEMREKYINRMKALLPDALAIEAFGGRLKFEQLNEDHKQRIRIKYKDRKFVDYDHVDLGAAKDFGCKAAKSIIQLTQEGV